MKERILQSLEGKATVLERYEKGSVFGVHFVMPGQSRWADGIHGYVLIDGDTVLGKDYSNGKGSTYNKPQKLTEYLEFHRRPGGSLDPKNKREEEQRQEKDKQAPSGMPERTNRALTIDQSITARRILDPSDKAQLQTYRRSPNRYDIPGVDTRIPPQARRALGLRRGS